MQAEAIKKLKDEMTEKPHPFVQMMGQFLIQHLESHPDDAAKVLVAEKTILKSAGALESEARKAERIGNMAMLTLEHGFKAFLNYFDIEDTTIPIPTMATMTSTVQVPTSVSTTKPKAGPPAKKTNKPLPPELEFDASLDDFLK